MTPNLIQDLPVVYFVTLLPAAFCPCSTVCSDCFANIILWLKDNSRATILFRSGCKIFWQSYFPRTVREVSSSEQDKIVPDSKVLEHLITVLHALDNNEQNLHCKTQLSEEKKTCLGVMYNALGYEIRRLDSTISGAGRGVFVTKGTIPAGSLVALYPGTRYMSCSLLWNKNSQLMWLVVGLSS